MAARLEITLYPRGGKKQIASVPPRPWIAGSSARIALSTIRASQSPTGHHRPSTVWDRA
jgi:hypothetical protein